jgi:hypothetical protein
MANSYVLYPAQAGTTTDYAVPFDYLSEDYVKATVDGVSAPFTFLSSSMIRFTTAPDGDLRIYRETSATPLTTFSDGAVLRGADLNQGGKQSLHIAEEAGETSLRDDLNGGWDGDSRNLKNLADPVDDQDAVTMGWAAAAGLVPDDLIALYYTAAVEAAASAEVDRAAAEAARDAAQLVGNVYQDTTAGLAATSEGGYFLVPSGVTGESLIVYREVAGAAVEVKRFPSSVGVVAGESTTDPVDTSGYSAKLVDSAGRVLLAFDGTGELVDSHGFVTRLHTLLGINAVPAPAYDNVPEHGLSFTYTDRNGCAIMGQSNGNATATGVGISLTQPFSNINAAGAALVSAAGAETCIMGTTTHAKWRQLKEMRPWDSWAIDYDWVYSALNSPSGTAIANISQGDATYVTALASVTTAKAAATTAGATYAERAILFEHGETDADTGTSQATYLAAMVQLKEDWNTDVAAVTGQTDRIPMFVAQVAIGDTGMVTPTKSTTPLAMLEAAETDDEIFITVPGYIMDHSDGTHYTAYNQRLIGEYFGKALHRYYIEGRNPSTVRPTAWTILDARTIEVEFYVPVPPLVFDIEKVWPGDLAMGFSVYDGSGVAVTITDVKIVDGTKVHITTGADVSAGYDVAYAFRTYSRTSTGGQLAGRRRGARGNLRDSDATLAYYTDENGDEIRLPNWCVIFRKTLA